MRTFHPRNALRGNAYGNVDKYYRWNGTIAKALGSLAKQIEKGLTLEESVAKGLTTREKVEFSDSEKTRLANLIEKLPENVGQEFKKKYMAWKETWNDPDVCIHSDPRKYAVSEQYAKLLTYCRKQGKAILPLLFQQLEQGDIFVINALEDLTFVEHRSLLDGIRQESAQARFDEKGVYIAPSIRANAMKYCKRLLASDMKGQFKESPKDGFGQRLNTPDRFALGQNYPNQFNPMTHIRYGLPFSSRVSLRIYDIMGHEIAVLVNDETKSKGWYTATWNGRDRHGNPVASGVYFCRLVAGKHVQISKIMLVR